MRRPRGEVRGRAERDRRPQQVEVVAELQLQAARMAASCVRSCRPIHVVSKHDAGHRSGLLVIDQWWCVWLTPDQPALLFHLFSAGGENEIYFFRMSAAAEETLISSRLTLIIQKQAVINNLSL